MWREAAHRCSSLGGSDSRGSFGVHYTPLSPVSRYLPPERHDLARASCTATLNRVSVRSFSLLLRCGQVAELRLELPDAPFGALDQRLQLGLKRLVLIGRHALLGADGSVQIGPAFHTQVAMNLIGGRAEARHCEPEIRGAGLLVRRDHLLAE